MESQLQTSIQCKLSNLYNQKHGFYNDSRFIQEVHSVLYDLNQIEFNNAFRVSQQKSEFRKARDKSKTLNQMLHTFNKMPKDDLSEYRNQKKNIKDFFFQNIDILHGVSDYIKDFDHKDQNDSGNNHVQENKIIKKVKVDGNKKPAQMSIAKEKVKENDERNPISFPFVTKKECVSRATSKPTFVKKGDLVIIMNKLGFQDKVQMPLTNMTKDELCELYFRNA